MTTTFTLRRVVLTLSLLAASLGSPPFARANDAGSPTVHLVAIGDSFDSNLGPNLADDARNMVTMFQRAFAQAGRSDQLKSHLILGEDANPTYILGLIAKLPIKANDALVVYDSAHGGTDLDHRHILTFDHGLFELNRETLLAAMKARNPRLAVLLTDVCSGYPRGSGRVGRPVVPNYTPISMPASPTMEWKTVSSLFLCHRGVVDMTAAEPGYNAVIDLAKPGSLFTNAFIQVLKTPYAELVRNLDRDGDSEIQWDEILPQVRGLAARFYQEQMGSGDRPQQAFARSLGVWTPKTLNAAR